MADIPLITDQYGRTRQMTAQEFKAATGRISAAPRDPQYLPGLNSWYALQNRGYPAFPDRRRPGLSTSEAAQDAASMGYTIGAQGVRPSYMPNNPSQGLRPTMAYSNSAQAGMTADEIRQANIDAAKKAGTFEKIRESYNARNSEGKKGGFYMGDGGDIWRQDESGDLTKDAEGRLIKASSEELAAVKGSPTSKPSAPVTLAQQRQMFRDAEMGRMEKRTGNRISEIQSKYGTGSVKMLKPGEARPVAMTTDEFGKPETMTSYLERRKAIQGTKGMATDKSGKPVSRADFLAGWKAPQSNARKA